VICNADEGDPGAFMDRSVLEGDPHKVLEGMAIAAFAIGADQGYVYVRGEYPLAIFAPEDGDQAGRAPASSWVAASSNTGFSPSRRHSHAGAGAVRSAARRRLSSPSIVGAAAAPRGRVLPTRRPSGLWATRP